MLMLLLSIGAIFLILIYINGKYNENYWKKRNVTFHKKNKVMGVFWDYLTKPRALFQNYHDIYKMYPNEPAVGIGSFFTPLLYVRDPLNIQHVLTSDFNSFNHRGIETNPDDKLADNILFSNGTKWKLVRQSMTPLFTSAKLKNMYYIMDKSAQDFVQHLKENPKLLKSDTFNTLSTYCSAAIGTAVFGVTSESVFDSPFLTVARKAMSTGIIRNLKFAIGNLSASLFKMLNLTIFKEFEHFFITVIKQLIQQRRMEKVKKNDFADICVSIQNNGLLRDASGMVVEPTDELLAAQAFFFLVAGVEPTASAMYATLMEIGQRPEVQKRLLNEIDEAFEKHGNHITYDVVSGMVYLDMVTCEAMRLNPPIAFLTRQCVQDTVLPTGNIKVDKGTKITVPVYELHHDAKYHPDPETFNPERFSEENRKNMLDVTYMPFGKGNRNCVGMRFAQLQAKSGLIHLLRHFEVRAKVLEGGVKYRKEQFQVRITNVNVELIPRNVEYE